MKADKENGKNTDKEELALSSYKMKFLSWILIKQIILSSEVSSHEALTGHPWTVSLSCGHGFNFGKNFMLSRRFGLTANIAGQKEWDVGYVSFQFIQLGCRYSCLIALCLLSSTARCSLEWIII